MSAYQRIKKLETMGSQYNNEIRSLGLKYNLAMRQGWRCLHCQNPILQKDIMNHNLHYIKPLQFGGLNDISNMGIKCNVCSSFSPY